MEEALLELLALWRDTRDPRVADAVDRVGATLRAEPIKGKTLDKQLDAWLAIAAKREPRDVSGLVGFPFPRGINALTRLVEGLLALPDDPRVARRLTDLLVELPVNSYAGRALTRRASRRLVALRDVRAVPRLQALLGGPSWVIGQAGVDAALADLANVEPTLVDDAILAPYRPPERDVATEAKFLDQIHANPDDDGAIAVYGDWLSEQSDPRGELIALQLLEPSKRADKRERELIAEHGDDWIGPLAPVFPSERVFERGFFAGGRAATAITAQHAAEPSWALIRVLAVPAYVDGPAMARIRELHLGDGGHLQETAFASAPDLRVLGLWGTPSNLRAWCSTAPVIERLERLVLLEPPRSILDVLAARRGPREIEIAMAGDRFHDPDWCVRLVRDTTPGPFTRVAATRRDGSLQKARELVAKLAFVPAEPVVELVATSRPIMLEGHEIAVTEAALARFANATRVEVPWLRARRGPSDGRTIELALDGISLVEDRLAPVWAALARFGQRYDVFAVNGQDTRRPLGPKPIERLHKWAPGRWLDVFNTGGKEALRLGSGGLGTSATLAIGGHSLDDLRALFLELFALTGSLAGTLGPVDARLDLAGLGAAPRAGWLMAFAPDVARRLDRGELAALPGVEVLPVAPLVLQLAPTPEAVTPEIVAALARALTAMLQRQFVATHGFDFRAAVRAVLDPIAAEHAIPLGREGPLEVRYYTQDFLEISAKLAPELYVSARHNNRAEPPYFHQLANGVVIDSPAKLDAELARVAAALRDLRGWFPTRRSTS